MLQPRRQAIVSLVKRLIHAPGLHHSLWEATLKRKNKGFKFIVTWSKSSHQSGHYPIRVASQFHAIVGHTYVLFVTAVGYSMYVVWSTGILWHRQEAYRQGWKYTLTLGEPQNHQNCSGIPIIWTLLMHDSVLIWLCALCFLTPGSCVCSRGGLELSRSKHSWLYLSGLRLRLVS